MKAQQIIAALQKNQPINVVVTGAVSVTVRVDKDTLIEALNKKKRYEELGLAVVDFGEEYYLDVEIPSLSGEN